MQNRNYFRLAIFATFLALVVVMLGAYTRLKDAGLGCPDWPGCYGQLTAPHTPAQLQKAEQDFPGQVVETGKAWKEMVHRYFAGSLGMIIVLLLFWAVVRRVRGFQDQPLVLPILLTLLVIFQAVLGMWTVTWKVLPLIVTAHLVMGMTVSALLWCLALTSGKAFRNRSLNQPAYRPWAVLGLLIIAAQIFLGAWTSTNYASIICTGFPFCQGSLFPAMNFHQAFNLFSPIGANYEGGLLDTTARITIQMTHRYGAFITAAYIILLAFSLLGAKKGTGLRSMGWALLIVICLQFLLGVANIEMQLPLAIAVAHNGVAALLLLTMVTLLYKLYSKPRELLLD
jgi:cytochrome c oxidase assembly protein subunit 15